jgi:glycosyltransferase involved in cell wall biosynthesis
MVHNNYAKPSGEEHASQGIAGLLVANGHKVSWYRRSSEEIIDSKAGQIKAFFSGIYNPFSIREISKVLDVVQPDIVQVQNLYPLISPSIMKEFKKRNIPVVMRTPNYRLFCPNGLFYTEGSVCESCTSGSRELSCIVKNCEDSIIKSTGYALRNAFARISGMIIDNVDIFITQSQFQKDQFIKFGLNADNIEILPALSPKIDLNFEERLGECISFIGRVSLEKGIVNFIEAARNLPDLKFAVAGNYDGLEKLIEESPKNITWHGFLSGEALKNFYLDSKIVLIPSEWYEGFPNIAVQAMFYKRPLICSNIGVFTNFIEDQKNGLLFEPGNTKDLVSKIIQLVDNPILQNKIVNYAKNEAHNSYSHEIIYAKLMNIYSKALTINNQRIGHG